jgi:hypothetical protein
MIKFEGQNKCFMAPRRGICNIIYVFITYLQIMKRFNLKKYQIQFERRNTSRAHLRIHKTNNKQVKVLVNTLDIIFHEN